MDMPNFSYSSASSIISGKSRKFRLPERPKTKKRELESSEAYYSIFWLQPKRMECYVEYLECV